MKGYVALTTVIIIIPLLLLTGIDTLYKNMTTLIVGKMNYDAQILRNNSESCLEETVYRLKRNRTYIGDFTISLENINCEISITDKTDNPGIKIISIQASDTSDIYITIEKELNTNTDPFEISNI